MATRTITWFGPNTKWDEIDASDTVTISVDFAGEMASGEAITSSSASDTPSGTLSLSATSVDGTKVSATIVAAGSPADYDITFTATTDAGQTFNRTGVLPVRNL
jgi:hypothetical protein